MEDGLPKRVQGGSKDHILGNRAAEMLPGERPARERAPMDRLPAERMPGERPAKERVAKERLAGDMTPNERCAKVRPAAGSALFDPFDFEERLKDARARRAIALASRPYADNAAGTNPRPGGLPSLAAASPTRPILPRPPEVADMPRAPRRAERGGYLPGGRAQPAETVPPDPARLDPAARRVAAIVAAFFVAGLVLGAGVVIFVPRQATEQASPPEPPRSEAAFEAASSGPPPQVPEIAAEAEPAPEPNTAPPDAPAVRAAAIPAAPEQLALAAPLPRAAPPPAAPVPAEAAAPISATLGGRPYPRPTSAAATAEAAPAAEPPALAQTLPANIRVNLHYPPSVAAPALDQTIAALQGAGFPLAERVPARVDVASTNVRYFHPEDAAAARQLAATLGSGAEARDFTRLARPAKPGTLEVWLAGDAPRRATAQNAGTASPEQILRILQARALGN